MPTRVSLRRMGAPTGKLAALPESMTDLLALATRKLNLASPATRIFSAGGDEFEDDDDLALMKEDEVIFVSCGEEYSHAAAPSVPAVVEQQPAPVEHPADVAVNLAPAATPDNSSAMASADKPDASNPFEVFSLDKEVAMIAKEKAKKPPPLSEAATRELLVANPSSAFARMALQGKAASGNAAGGTAAALGKTFYLKIIGKSGSVSNPGLYAFGQDPKKFLTAREDAPADTSASDDAPPPLLMGEWDQVTVPPKIAKKDKGVPKIGLVPHLSAMKKVYESQQRRMGVAVWEYPSDERLLAMEVQWHDFSSVTSAANHTLVKRATGAAKATARAAMPISDDQGGVLKIKRAFDVADRERQEKSAKIQKQWDERDADIDARLTDASDAHARALPEGKEAAQMAIDIIKDEQSNFFSARSQEKVELEEARKDAKRKHEADLEKQRVYNKKIKSGAHKKAMEAYAQSPMDVDPDSDVDVGAASLGMANAAVRAAAQARDPIALASKRAAAIATAIAGTASSTVGAALAAALAPYQAPATATAVTCRGTATSTVGAALAAALAPYHVREV